MNSDIEYDAELQGKKALMESNFVKKPKSQGKTALNEGGVIEKSNSQKTAIQEVASLTLSEVLKGNGPSHPKKKAITVDEIKMKYEAQLEEVSRCLGINQSEMALGKLQAGQLLKVMSLEDINNIKNRVLREKIYAAKVSSIEINFKNLSLDNSSKYKNAPQLDSNFFLNENDSMMAATRHFAEIEEFRSVTDLDELQNIEDLVDQVQNLQFSLDVLSTTLGVTLTAADLSRGISHYMKLYKLDKKLKKTKKNLEIVEKELLKLEDIEQNKEDKDSALNYTELYDEITLRKKELEVNKHSLQNAKKIIKKKLDESLTDAAFSGVPAAASLAGVILLRAGGEAAKGAGGVALGAILGGVNIVEGGIGLVEDTKDLKAVNNELKEIKVIFYSTKDSKVSNVFSTVIKLKMDNLNHYQKQQIYLHIIDDILNILQGVSSIAGEFGAVGAQAITAGAAVSRASLQLGNFIYNHRSDVEDLVHRKIPPVIVREQIAHELSSKNKDVLENTHYLQDAIQRRALISSEGEGILNDNIQAFRQIEILKPKWEQLDLLVVERLMIDRTSSKRREEARGLAEDINAMSDHEFKTFKEELITQKILRPTSASKSKASVIKEVNKFIKSRGQLVES